MASFFESIPLAPPNSILGVAAECKKDPNPLKINLTIGAYRDSNGNPVVLDCVREAERRIFEANYDHEYLSQDGLPEFLTLSQKLMFGDNSKLISEERVLTVQGLSGTGCLRLASEFIGTFLQEKTCYIPEVTWPNHPAILDACRVKQGTYRYLDSTGCNLDFEGLMEDLNSFPHGSIILFHNCAHNPTGVDPSNEQWLEILQVVLTRNFFPFFDNAYQGFVSGCVHRDAFAVRTFAEAGLEMVVACSFAKNFGLYGERVGALHFVVSAGAAESENHMQEFSCVKEKRLSCVASQLRVLSRGLYSTCPAHGARIVSTVLGDPTLKAAWEAECAGMAHRLRTVRELLYGALVFHAVKGDWIHVFKQRGMFSYTGISSVAVKELKERFHVFMLSNGRISLAGLNEGNVDYFAESLAAVLGKNEA